MRGGGVPEGRVGDAYDQSVSSSSPLCTQSPGDAPPARECAGVPARECAGVPARGQVPVLVAHDTVWAPDVTPVPKPSSEDPRTLPAPARPRTPPKEPGGGGSGGGGGVEGADVDLYPSVLPPYQPSVRRESAGLEGNRLEAGGGTRPHIGAVTAPPPALSVLSSSEAGAPPSQAPSIPSFVYFEETATAPSAPHAPSVAGQLPTVDSGGGGLSRARRDILELQHLAWLSRDSNGANLTP